MSYAHLFQNPVNEMSLPSDILLDVAGLTPQQQTAVLTWVNEQADLKTAEARLRELLRQALYDVSAAELGILLHQPGIA